MNMLVGLVTSIYELLTSVNANLLITAPIHEAVEPLDIEMVEPIRKERKRLPRVKRCHNKLIFKRNHYNTNSVRINQPKCNRSSKWGC